MAVSHEQIRSKIVDTLGQVSSVLDVGCGNCDLVRFLARYLATDAIGVDINGGVVQEKVHSEADDRRHTVECRHIDAQHMDEFAEGRFDAAVSVHALHEIADIEVALTEIRRVLKKGGVFLIGDFTVGESRWDEDYLTPEELAEILHRTRFERIQVEKVPGEHFMFASATK